MPPAAAPRALESSVWSTVTTGHGGEDLSPMNWMNPCQMQEKEQGIVSSRRRPVSLEFLKEEFLSLAPLLPGLSEELSQVQGGHGGSTWTVTPSIGPLSSESVTLGSAQELHTISMSNYELASPSGPHPSQTRPERLQVPARGTPRCSPQAP